MASISEADGFLLEPRWQFEADSPIIRPPLYAEGAVYIYTQDRQLVALDAQDGQVRWQIKVPLLSTDHNTIFYQGRVIKVQLSRYLEVRSAEDGRLLWQVDGQASAVAAGDGKVFLSRDRHGRHIQAYDLDDGTLLWEYKKTETTGLNEERIFYDPTTNEVVSAAVILDADTGDLKSTFSIYRGRPSGHSAVLNARYVDGQLFYGEYVYDVHADRVLFADRERNMAVLKFHLPTSLESGLHFLYQGGVLVAQDIDDFTIRWRQPFDDGGWFRTRLRSNVVAFDEAAYVLLADDTLRALDLVDGHEVGRLDMGKVVETERGNKIIPGLAHSERLLFVSPGTQWLYAFGSKEPTMEE